MTIQVPTRTVLAFLVLAIAVPVAMFAAVLIQRAWGEQRAMVDRQNVDTARAVMVAIDQEVQKVATALTVIGALDLSSSASPMGTDGVTNTDGAGGTDGATGTDGTGGVSAIGKTAASAPRSSAPPLAAAAKIIPRFNEIAPVIVARQPGWRALFLLDPSGRRIGGTSPTPILDLPDVAALVHDVAVSGHTGYSDLIADPADRTFVYLLAMPILHDGAVRFILVADVATQTLSDVLRRQHAPPDGVVTLTDRSRRIMARTRGEELYVGQRSSRAFVDAASRMNEGAWTGTLLEGQMAYSALSRSGLTGWVVGLGLPAAQVDATVFRSLWMLAGAGIVVVGFGLLAATLFGNLLIRGLDDCAGAAESLSKEQPILFRPSRIREVAHVARSIDIAAKLQSQRLHERDTAESLRVEAARLREVALSAESTARVASERNEARLMVTLRSIGDAVIATDASGRITLMNPVAQALTGWSEAAASGEPIERVFDIINEDTRLPVENPVTKVFRHGSVVGLANHTVLRARDGREVPIEDSAAPIHGSDETLIGIVLVFRDCTTQREEERRREALLLREQAAREEAENISRAKDEFLATLSHELRTPLNAILGWSQMLRRGQVEEGARVRAMEIIERNARVQAQLVEDLLDMSRVVRGQVHLEMRDVKLAPILDAVFDAVRPAADAKDITLVLRDDLADAVAGDAARLQQVFWNLLTNSTKFTPKGGRIEVRLFRDGSEAVAEVADTGAGMSAELLPHVFERFRQGKTDLSQGGRGGLGIGLSLVRHLVELHGGTVAAASAGEGFGSTFTVRLPILGPRAVAAGDAASDIASSRVLRGVRVLVVEDEEDSRELIGLTLTHAGAEPTLTASVADAIGAMETRPVDVVITDISMPDRDGYEMLRSVRAAVPGARLPVIALSARARREEIEQAMGVRFDFYLEKPVDPQALTQAVAAAVGRG